jgi:hypothetical protein
MADDPSLRCGATPEQTFLRKRKLLDWSLVAISPSNHMTHGDSPAAAPGQKRARDTDGQIPLAILNGTRGNTMSYHTSQNRENCETKMMEGNEEVSSARGPRNSNLTCFCFEAPFHDGF